MDHNEFDADDMIKWLYDWYKMNYVHAGEEPVPMDSVRCADRIVLDVLTADLPGESDCILRITIHDTDGNTLFDSQFWTSSYLTPKTQMELENKGIDICHLSSAPHLEERIWEVAIIIHNADKIMGHHVVESLSHLYEEGVPKTDAILIEIEGCESSKKRLDIRIQIALHIIFFITFMIAYITNNAGAYQLSSVPALFLMLINMQSDTEREDKRHNLLFWLWAAVAVLCIIASMFHLLFSLQL